MSEQHPYKRCILILADGARPDVMGEELKAGNLPNLSRYFAESGTCQTMLSCFPSTTGPAYLPYVTGCFPGTCNIPGIRWFDKPTYAKKGWGLKSFRSYCGLEAMLFDGDMEQKVTTAWEVFENPTSIFNGVTKGLKSGGDLTKFSRIWHYYYSHLTDRWAFIDQAALKKTKRMIEKKEFDFSFVVLPSIDEYAHRSGPKHKRVRQAYAELDTIVGEMIQSLKDNDIYEETLLYIVSDHGHSETTEHFDIGPWLEEKKNLKTFYYTNIFKFKFDAVSMVSGNGMSHLYLKGKNGWESRKTFEEISYDSLLLDELRQRPEIDIVVTEGADGSIHLQTERGHSSFKVDRRDQIWYQFDGRDPLGIFENGDDRLNRSFSFDESLQYTFSSNYPDVFVQMHQIFKSDRAGDVIVSAKPGYDLRKKFEHPLHKSGHGGLHPLHMRIPLLCNHPIPKQLVRSVDIYPTMLKLMGKPVPSGLDGRCLV
jgi:predicted AlkP superfamily phosphohydrolase/phosphomutase